MGSSQRRSKILGKTMYGTIRQDVKQTVKWVSGHITNVDNNCYLQSLPPKKTRSTVIFFLQFIWKKKETWMLIFQLRNLNINKKTLASGKYKHGDSWKTSHLGLTLFPPFASGNKPSDWPRGALFIY